MIATPIHIIPEIIRRTFFGTPGFHDSILEIFDFISILDTAAKAFPEFAAESVNNRRSDSIYDTSGVMVEILGRERCSVKPYRVIMSCNKNSP